MKPQPQSQNNLFVNDLFLLEVARLRLAGYVASHILLPNKDAVLGPELLQIIH